MYRNRLVFSFRITPGIILMKIPYTSREINHDEKRIHEIQSLSNTNIHSTFICILDMKTWNLWLSILRYEQFPWKIHSFLLIICIWKQLFRIHCVLIMTSSVSYKCSNVYHMWSTEKVSFYILRKFFMIISSQYFLLEVGIHFCMFLKKLKRKVHVLDLLVQF